MQIHVLNALLKAPFLHARCAIKFTREDGRWLHGEVHAQYLEDGAESPVRPNCQFLSPPS